MISQDASLYLSQDDLFLLAKGSWFKSYEKLGAHPAEKDGRLGYHFAVWAPDVKSVHVIGSFNGWDEGAHPLSCSATGGVWEGFIPDIDQGVSYKYLIETRAGEKLYKADPYGFWAEVIPETASRTFDIAGYEWGDKRWMAARKKTDHLKRPLNIYEVHLGSWKRHDDGLLGNGGSPEKPEDGTGSYLSYDELSDQLVAYVKEMGYSHIELMPVMEHPFDGSWGYQIVGYYAPTSRFGDPKQFKHFVDACHQAGIGVILDWVPGGCCPDAHGLARFNGGKLYEGLIHPTWGTLKFDVARGEVRSFLVSNLLYWIGEYHADGVRMDGVTSMLYLNFGIDEPARKRFNSRGTEEDDDAIAFVRQCNAAVGTYYPDVMMIAEESTAWPLVTYPPEVGGLGFNYKWDMGWMHDTLHYMQTDFPYRPGNHGLLTFSIMYAFNENFVLALSHDEVVHGKCSLIIRQPGDNWRQFAGLRALAFYQMTHPGAKLNFMGNEIGQFIEWRYYEGLEFFLVDRFEAHAKHQQFIAELNRFYKETRALWEISYTSEGFEWIDADNRAQSVLTYIRHAKYKKDDVVVLVNMDINAHEDFRMGVPRSGIYEEIFNTDDQRFGGSGVCNGAALTSEAVPWNGLKDSVVVRVPPLAGIVLKRTAPLPPKKPAAKKAVGKKPVDKTPVRTSKRTSK